MDPLNPSGENSGPLGRWQVSLSTLLALIFVLGLALGWLVDHRRLQRDLEQRAAIGSQVEQELKDRLDKERQLQNRYHFDRANPSRTRELIRAGAEVYAEPTTVILAADGMSDAHVAQLHDLTTLRVVHVHGLGFTEHCLRPLTDLSSLKALFLTGPWITSRTLTDVATLKSLERLGIDDARITSDELDAIKGLEKLEILSIRDTPIGDPAVEHLKQLRSLKELRLDGTNVTDDGVHELSSVRELKLLTLRRTKVTAKGIERLRQILPECRILLDDNSAVNQRPASDPE